MPSSSSGSSSSTSVSASVSASVSPGPTALAPLLVLAAAALWGTTGTVASLAPPGSSPLAIGAATMGLGGLLTLALAGRSALVVLRAGPRTLRLALFGALNVAVYPLAFYTSMAWAGVAVGTVVTLGSAPVFAALLERLVDGTALTRRWATATAAATAGTAALAVAGPGGGTADRVPDGVLLGLLAGASYAAYAYCGARIMRRGHSSRATMGALFGMAAGVLLPVFAATGGGLVAEPRGVVVAGYLALVPMCLGYLLFGAGLARTSVSTATTLTLLEPVVAAVLGVAVVGERLGGWGWAGTGLVALGLVLLTAGRRAAPVTSVPSGTAARMRRSTRTG
ncbi:EamA family transporter [Streptomyces sp. B6B3]|uniref:EamA family transporter n=1 Tax=Streptomyces sp. B6B3 TaxID=3153570 RepID=UPI00325F1744